MLETLINSHALTVPLSHFQQLVQRLLHQGVICRDDSNVERDLYDTYLRVEDDVVAYFELAGLHILHEPKLNYLRLLPPGATAPGMIESNSEVSSGMMRSSLSQDEVALLLTLRLEYDNGLRSAEVDESGAVMLTLETINLAYHRLFDDYLPVQLTERRALFRRMRQLRVIQVQLDELDDPQSWVWLKPVITTYVNGDVLDDLSAEVAEQGQLSELSEPADNDTPSPSNLFE